MSGPLARRVHRAEADRILARASRHDLQRPDVGDAVTVSDLMEAAAAVGLEPQEVRRAALIERVPPARTFGTVAFGAGSRRDVRAHLTGVEMPDDTAGLERAAEAGLARRGTVLERKEGRFVWGEDGALGRSTVAVEQRDDGIDVRVSADRTGTFTLSWFFGTFALSVLAAMVGLQAQIGVVATVLLIGLLPLIFARPFWKRTERRTLALIEDTTMSLLRVLDSSSTSANQTRRLGPADAGTAAVRIEDRIGE